MNGDRSKDAGAIDPMATLARKHEYFQAIFEHAFQFIGLLAPDGTVLEANQRSLDFIGVSRDDVAGRPFWDTPWWTHDPTLQLTLRQAVNDAARGRFVRFEATHCDVNGEMATFDFSLTPVKNEAGNIVLLVPEGRDITERKRAETWHTFLAEAGAVLATSLDYEETLRNIAAVSVRALADCCIVDLVEESGDVRRLRVAHGAPIRPWYADYLERVPLDRRRPHLVWSVLATRHPVLMQKISADYVTSLAQHDEHLRALRALGMRSLMAVPLVARGRLLGTLTFVSSRPSRTYGADDLRLAQDLADRAALAVENAMLYRAAQEAIQARDEILGVVAHDLRNPLSAIDATATVLRQFFLANGGDTTREAMDGILRASQRANHLVQDLLEIRRISAGRLVLQCETVSPACLVRECVDAHRPLTAAATLELVKDDIGSLPHVRADRHRVLQVFENLIGNAVKFTPAGGRISVGARQRGGDVVFCVSDTGPGIAPDTLGRLFQPFWQARPHDARGIGLGLSIAKEVVEAHGGRIWAESQQGIGSAFFFTIPVA